MNSPFKIPFYARVSVIVIGIFAFISMLYLAQSIIVPIIYATIIAIVLSPVVSFLVRKKLNRIIAIAITIVIVIIAFMSIIALLSSQVSMFSESFPRLSIKFDQL